MKKQNRRQFLTTATRFTAGAALLPSLGHAAPGKTSRFTIGLSQYSLRAMIKDGSLDPLDFPAFTMDQFGIEAIDLWEGVKASQRLLEKTLAAV